MSLNLLRRSVWLSQVMLVLTIPPATAAAQPVSKDRIAIALPKLEAMAEEMVRKNRVPGLAIGVVYDDEVIYLRGFSRREAGKPDSVDADTVFQIASCSKPISATVIAALVSEGLIGWDSRIADLDASFRLANPYPTSELTIRDLFAHRSGSARH